MILVKPKPWLSYNNGGEPYNWSWAMRFKDSREQEVYIRHESEAGWLELVLTALDVPEFAPVALARQGGSLPSLYAPFRPPVPLRPTAVPTPCFGAVSVSVWLW